MSIRQSIPINLRPTDWIDTKANSKWIGLIEVPNLNQVQSIRQSGLIVANCVDDIACTAYAVISCDVDV